MIGSGARAAIAFGRSPLSFRTDDPIGAPVHRSCLPTRGSGGATRDYRLLAPLHRASHQSRRRSRWACGPGFSSEERRHRGTRSRTSYPGSESSCRPSPPPGTVAWPARDESSKPPGVGYCGSPHGWRKCFPLRYRYDLAIRRRGGRLDCAVEPESPAQGSVRGIDREEIAEGGVGAPGADQQRSPHQEG